MLQNGRLHFVRTEMFLANSLAEIKPDSHHITPYTGFKGDVTRNDSQRRFLAQRDVATTLLGHCFE